MEGTTKCGETNDGGGRLTARELFQNGVIPSKEYDTSYCRACAYEHDVCGKSCPCAWEEAVQKRLWENENMEEDGYIIRMPIMLGATVWYWTEFSNIDEGPIKGTVIAYHTQVDGTKAISVEEADMIVGKSVEEFDIDKIGICVFTNESDAIASFKTYKEKIYGTEGDESNV